MKSLVAALQLMTRLPMPRIEAEAHDYARAIRWFPLAGLVLGLCLAVAAFAGIGLLGAGQGGALMVLLSWVAVTGALHLDGLGDIADGAGAAHAGRERLSAVLADPHVGSFAVTVIALQLIAKFALLSISPWTSFHCPRLMVCVLRGMLCSDLTTTKLSERVA